ncbi:MAG: very short patch repair endonuclease [Chloroflexi bacterium]|nr:MAG: very short patch repair endonuclease [Chloroflexota bacterium]
MRRNPKRDTRPELALRSELHARGARFRTNLLVRIDGLNVRPDVVFPKKKVAVFVDGCFWHGCAQHGNLPRRNPDYWVPKLERNARRDALVNERLSAAGWEVVRIWEHEPPGMAADAVMRVVQATFPLDLDEGGVVLSKAL